MGCEADLPPFFTSSFLEGFGCQQWLSFLASARAALWGKFGSAAGSGEGVPQSSSSLPMSTRKLPGSTGNSLSTSLVPLSPSVDRNQRSCSWSFATSHAASRAIRRDSSQVITRSDQIILLVILQKLTAIPNFAHCSTSTSCE